MQRPMRPQWPPAVEHALLAAVAVAPKPSASTTPEQAPLVAVRNALLSPGTVVPLRLVRSTSRAAIQQALASDRLLAVFAQFDSTEGAPRERALHPVGTLVSVSSAIDGASALWAVVRALTWIRLASVDDTGPCGFARLEPFVVHAEGGEELARLERAVRARVRAFAATLPDPEPVLAAAEAMSALELADAATAQPACKASDTARYVSESSLLRRLKWVLARADGTW